MRVANWWLVTVVAVAGCGGGSSLGPPVPSDATEIGGPPVASAPPPPAGWSPKDVVPTSQQQAQDTLVGYLKRTLHALPPGTALDSTGFSGPGHNIGCDDDATDKGAPVHFQTIANVTVPGNPNPTTTIKKGRRRMAELGLVRLRTRRVHQAESVRLRTRRLPLADSCAQRAQLPSHPARLDTVLPGRHCQR